MIDVVEEYNQLLRRSEDDTIRLLNGVLDKAFNRLVRRTRIHMRVGYADNVLRNRALLQEFRQLIPAFRADRLDRYDRLLRTLLQRTARQGIEVASVLTREMNGEKPRVDVRIPLEATYQAAAQAKGYLRKHGQKFAETSAEVVAQGIVEGRPTDEIVNDMRARLGVVKSRAETIVRTEALRAYNEASNTYYSAQGVDQVLYYATADDRSCPVCAPRAGNVYQRNSIKVPVHPRCVLPSTKIHTGTIVGAVKAQYFGWLVTIGTSSGRRLTVTENHPVATSRGWIRANEVREGDELFSYSSRVPRSFGFTAPNFHNEPTTAEQIFKALRAEFPMSTATVPASTLDLHGDGGQCHGDIEVVWSDRSLMEDIETPNTSYLKSHIDLQWADMSLSEKDSLRFFDFLLLSLNAGVSGSLRIFKELQPLFARHASIAEMRSLRTSSWGEPCILEPAYHGGPVASEHACKLINSQTRLVETEKANHIEIEELTQPIPVYDFTTKSSCYFAENLLVHNCRCYLAPWDSDIDAMDSTYSDNRTNHKKEVAEASAHVGLIDSKLLNKAGVFELLAPTPIQ